MRIIKTFEKQLAKVNIEAITYQDVNEYAVVLGEILATAFNLHITEAPGEVIEDILNDRLKENHRLITEFGKITQDILNKKANIGLATQIPKVSQDRIDGLVGRLKEDDFEKNKWLLDSPIVNFSQAVVDDMIRKNAEFHFHSGMSPKIVRKEVGNCCKWCKSLVGSYSYPDVPKDVYRRHRNCHCTVDYYPGNGKKQNAWSKKWSKEGSNISERRKLQKEDIRSNNRETDKKEYFKIISILGEESSPVSLDKFQDLKYNNSVIYERLLDKVFIKEKIQKELWGTTINSEKQAPHVQSTNVEGKSYLFDNINPQDLFDKYSGTGKIEKDRNGVRTNKEVIELDSMIGVAVSEFGSFETNIIKIHHSKNRAHIVPKERR